jgi:hypothetical protein
MGNQAATYLTVSFGPGLLKNSAGSNLSTSANFPMISKPTQVTARSILLT